MFLALMDEDGFVQFASVANVAHQARIEDMEAEDAITTLESADANSADQDNDGRRIEHVPGGWIVLNAKKYRDLVTREMVREQTKQRVAKFRAKNKSGNGSVTPCNKTVTPSDTDTDTERRGANGSLPTVDDWLKELQKDKTYDGIDVQREYGKMLQWCYANKKTPTRRRFVNWLNRVDKPLPKSRAVTFKSRYRGPVHDLTDDELSAQRKIVRECSEKLKAELNR